MAVYKVGREDRGIYQCISSNKKSSAQAMAELKLGGKVNLIILIDFCLIKFFVCVESLNNGIICSTVFSVLNQNESNTVDPLFFHNFSFFPINFPILPIINLCI